jgi:hypothetical protein
MKGVLLVALVGFVSVMVAGCVIPSGAPITGGLYTDIQGPVAIGDTTAGFSKVGQAKATGIICVATGNCSIKKAAENGNITKIHHVDNYSMSVLGVYSMSVTTVYGE